MPPDRAHTFENAPLDELLTVLLRQLKRPLSAHGVTFTDADAARLVSAYLNNETSPMVTSVALVGALTDVVKESETVLQQMGLTFQAALDTSMDKLPGWETTAEFLELANEKANAELRIALGAALLLALGQDRRNVSDLLHLAGGDYGDETVIARRVLVFASGVESNVPDWLEQVRTWAAEKKT